MTEQQTGSAVGGAGDVLDCGHACAPDGMVAGYATWTDGSRICYACADAETRDQVACSVPGDRITLYVGGRADVYGIESEHTIVSWSGGVVMRAYLSARSTRCGFGYTRLYDVYGYDDRGRKWHGIGQGSGMYVNLRLTRG